MGRERLYTVGLHCRAVCVLRSVDGHLYLDQISVNLIEFLPLVKLCERNVSRARRASLTIVPGHVEVLKSCSEAPRRTDAALPDAAGTARTVGPPTALDMPVGGHATRVASRTAASCTCGGARSVAAPGVEAGAWAGEAIPQCGISALF